MKASDLPALDFNDPEVNPAKRVPQEEIDRINDLYANIRRKGRQIIKEALDLGDLLIATRKKLNPNPVRDVYWNGWLTNNCPKLSRSVAFQFEKLARNREYIETVSRDVYVLSITEASRMISQKDKMAKPRVRRLVVSSDADPLVLLEAQLKNYVINLWMLRYLQTEIEGMLESMDLTPAQVLKVLHYVCKEHHEVEDEVLRTFKPGLKIVSKGA